LVTSVGTPVQGAHAELDGGQNRAREMTRSSFVSGRSERESEDPAKTKRREHVHI
jgi:hypothetical protein